MDQTAEAGANRVLSSRLDREEVLAKVALLSERHLVESRQRSALGDVLPGAANSKALSGQLPEGDSEARYRLLFDSSPLPMWVYDLETLAFLAVNKAAVRHYGYPADDFLRMTIRDIRPAENVDALIARVAVLDMGLDMTGTWKHRKKSGAVIDVEITSHELMFDGRRARLVLANDVTERKRAELALAQQMEREALINRISGAVRRSLDPAEVFRTAVNELGIHLSVDRCLLFTLVGNPSVVSCAAEYVAPGIAPGVKSIPLRCS
ncbi:MAG: PAS domain S-box protein [Pyrinomonadaceae bacterium]